MTMLGARVQAQNCLIIPFFLEKWRLPLSNPKDLSVDLFANVPGRSSHAKVDIIPFHYFPKPSTVCAFHFTRNDYILPSKIHISSIYVFILLWVSNTHSKMFLAGRCWSPYETFEESRRTVILPLVKILSIWCNFSTRWEVWRQ